MTNRKELEEVIREAVACVLEGCGDKEKLEETDDLGESSQSGRTTKKTPEAYRLKDTSGNFGEKGKVPSYAKKYHNANAGVRADTKRQLNKKDRQAAKKELDEAIATAVRGVFEGCGDKEKLEEKFFDKSLKPGDLVKMKKGKAPKTEIYGKGYGEVLGVEEFLVTVRWLKTGESERLRPDFLLNLGSSARSNTGPGESESHLAEVSPPGREDQVKTLKGELPATYKDKETGETKKSNPWSVAWSSFAKGKKEE